jgi:peptide-methionine (S)-S-oxide reductase
MRTMRITIMLTTIMLAGFACNRPPDAGSNSANSADTDNPAHKVASRLPMPAVDESPDNAAKDEEVAVFAGGCFWCTEALFEQLKGVKDVVSGYAGGSAANAKYDIVSTGTTGHAESVQITYDPHQITYGSLLRIFFATHDPTQLNRQGPDVGTQYRSAVFYANDDQKKIAAAYIKQLDASGHFQAPIATTVEPLNHFYPAEQYHQDFAKRNPDYPYIRYWLPEKMEKLEKAAPDQLKNTPSQ